MGLSEKTIAHINKYSVTDDRLAWQTLQRTILIFFGTFFGVYFSYKWFGEEGAVLVGLPWLLRFAIQALAVLCRAGMYVRVFIVFHDMAHMSFFKNPRQNYFWGTFLGWVISSPFNAWRHYHNHHHAHLGDYDVHDESRTVHLTIKQYHALPWYYRIPYRVLRDPFVFFALAPPALFMVKNRFKCWKASVYFFVYLYLFIRIFDYPLFYREFGSMVLAVQIGVALFHLQHQVNLAYWVPHDDYDPLVAGLKGSTFLAIPWFMKWVTLGIEYHHIHHVSTRVPCYYLQECHETAPPGTWDEVTKVGSKLAFISMFNALWNDETKRFEPFPYIL